MAQAMKGVSRAMMNMNRQMNMPQIQQILHEFEKQSEIMDMKEEMINDAIDDGKQDHTRVYSMFNCNDHNFSYGR